MPKRRRRRSNASAVVKTVNKLRRQFEADASLMLSETLGFQVKVRIVRTPIPRAPRGAKANLAELKKRAAAMLCAPPLDDPLPEHLS